MSEQELKLPALEKLDKLKAGVLFMNLGPERIELAFKLIRSKIKEVDYVAWIAPNALFMSKVYKSALEQYSTGIRSKMFFFPIEGVSNADARYLRLCNLVDKYKIFCVVDDSLTIKNTEAGRTKRLLALANRIQYRIILSSLPLTQGLVDLYSQIQFMNSKLLNMTETQFANIYLPYFEDEFKVWKRWSLPEHEEALVEKMRPYIYDADFDFGYKVRDHDVFFELSAEEKKAYAAEKDEFLSKRYQVPFMEVVHTFQQFYSICKSKVEALFDLVSEIVLRGEKVIIYLRFLEEVKFFQECGWFEKGEYVVLTGRTEKYRAIKAFEKDVNVMFCSYGVDNLGLNMQLCNNVIFFSQTFDYKRKIQMMHYFYRPESPCEINVYNFWVKTGLDEMIRKNLMMKQDVLNNVCNIISKEEALRL